MASAPTPGAQPNAQDPAEGTITLVGSTLDADQLRKRLQDVEKKCAEYRNALRNAHNQNKALQQEVVRLGSDLEGVQLRQKTETSILTSTTARAQRLQHDLDAATKKIADKESIIKTMYEANGQIKLYAPKGVKELHDEKIKLLAENTSLQKEIDELKRVNHSLNMAASMRAAVSPAKPPPLGPTKKIAPEDDDDLEALMEQHLEELMADEEGSSTKTKANQAPELKLTELEKLVETLQQENKSLQQKLNKREHASKKRKEKTERASAEPPNPSPNDLPVSSAPVLVSLWGEDLTQLPAPKPVDEIPVAQRRGKHCSKRQKVIEIELQNETLRPTSSYARPRQVLPRPSQVMNATNRDAAPSTPHEPMATPEQQQVPSLRPAASGDVVIPTDLLRKGVEPTQTIAAPSQMTPELTQVQPQEERSLKETLAIEHLLSSAGALTPKPDRPFDDILSHIQVIFQEQSANATARYVEKIMLGIPTSDSSTRIKIPKADIHAMKVLKTLANTIDGYFQSELEDQPSIREICDGSRLRGTARLIAYLMAGLAKRKPNNVQLFLAEVCKKMAVSGVVWTPKLVFQLRVAVCYHRMKGDFNGAILLFCSVVRSSSKFDLFVLLCVADAWPELFYRFEPQSSILVDTLRCLFAREAAHDQLLGEAVCKRFPMLYSATKAIPSFAEIRGHDLEVALSIDMARSVIGDIELLTECLSSNPLPTRVIEYIITSIMSSSTMAGRINTGDVTAALTDIVRPKNALPFADQCYAAAALSQLSTIPSSTSALSDAVLWYSALTDVQLVRVPPELQSLLHCLT